jgi:AcrR family transcriptional regulator
VVTCPNRPEARMADDLRSPSRSARTEAKRDGIVESAMRHFAEHGYQGARIEDIAGELGIAKGSIFQHFGSKSGLFFEAYKRAALSLPAWLDAPQDVLAQGFFAAVRYWLHQTGHLVAEDWVPNRVALIGTYGTDLQLKHEINRWLVSEDPYGTLEFVEFGIERGEVRSDIDLELIVSIVDWLSERFQDAMVAQELDPGLFHRHKIDREERQRERIEQFAAVLQSAIGKPAQPTAGVAAAG